MSTPRFAANIVATIARLDDLAVIVANEPAFEHWHVVQTIDLNLIQLFPIESDTPYEVRRSQAKAIARAIGGKWTCDLTKGSWATVDGSGEFCRTHLHYVEPESAPAIVEVTP